MPFVTALVALDEDPAVRLCTYIVGRRAEDLVADAPVAVDVPAARVHDGARTVGRRPDVRALVIYDGLRVVDCTTGIAGAYCAKLLTDLGADVVFATPIAGDPCSPTCGPRSGTPGISPWLAAADIVIVGEPGRAAGGAVRPLVTVSITALGHGGPDDGLELPEEVLQARSGSLSAHGHMHLPPLTVGGHLGEYIVGAFAALGAVTAWSARVAHRAWRKRSMRRCSRRSS